MMCEHCAQDNDHHALCPMTYVESDPNRKAALDMGVPVATSDWVDAAFMATNGQKNARDVLTDMFTLHHRYVERITTARVQANLAVPAPVSAPLICADGSTPSRKPTPSKPVKKAKRK